jgi:hypothetical protein
MTGTISYNSTTKVLSGTGWTSKTAYSDFDGIIHWGFSIWERAVGSTPWTKIGTVYNPNDSVQDNGTVCPGTFTFSYTAKSNYEYKAQRYESGYDVSYSPYTTEYPEDVSNILQITGSSPASIILSDSNTLSYVDSFAVTIISVTLAQIALSDSNTVSFVDTVLVTVSPTPVQVILTDSITNSSVSLSISLQTPNSIGGKVQMADSSPVAGADVYAIESGTNRVLVATTDANGDYLIVGIIDGNVYHISCVYQDGGGNKYTSQTNSYVS